jgi:excisionase family DNA binding protein
MPEVPPLEIVVRIDAAGMRSLVRDVMREVLVELRQEGPSGIARHEPREIPSQPAGAAEMDADRLVTVKQVAAFLAIGVTKVYQLMDRGELPYSKIGAARRVPIGAVRALAKRHLVGGPGDLQETKGPASQPGPTAGRT